MYIGYVNNCDKNRYLEKIWKAAACFFVCDDEMYMFKSNNLLFFSVLFSVIPGFVAYLIKDNALNDLCGKTLGIRIVGGPR